MVLTCKALLDNRRSITARDKEVRAAAGAIITAAPHYGWPIQPKSAAEHRALS